MDNPPRRRDLGPAPAQHVPKTIHRHRPPVRAAPDGAPRDRGALRVPDAGATHARVPRGAQRGRAAAAAPGDPQGHGPVRGVPEGVPRARDGAGARCAAGEDGQLGRGAVDAPGPGGQDAGRGEHEAVLDDGGGEEHAHVSGRVGVGAGEEHSVVLGRKGGRENVMNISENSYLLPAGGVLAAPRG
ncbi:hypothetical protein CGCSCA5_v000870 [Colletotrichum siamense]|nr:hypothetical protein CGCSCA5_v000870 [Colletotrichum siamense]